MLGEWGRAPRRQLGPMEPKMGAGWDDACRSSEEREPAAGESRREKMGKWDTRTRDRDEDICRRRGDNSPRSWGHPIEIGFDVLTSVLWDLGLGDDGAYSA
eukprot:scaffold613_cov243-Pinguiococcus_pyrenoidosus.AAC.26